MYSERITLKFGLYASISLVVLTLITWALGMMAIPPSGPYCPGDCMDYPYSELLDYYPRDYYWMYVAIFQVIAFVLFISSVHFIVTAERKLYSFISCAFAIIASTILLLAYFIQFSVVPISMMKGQTECIALLTQYNGNGLFIAMEDLGYFIMSVSFFFLGIGFSGKTGLERTIRWIFILTLILTLAAFAYYTINFGLDRSYRFEVAAISINWLASISGGILAFIFFKRRLNINTKQAI